MNPMCPAREADMKTCADSKVMLGVMILFSLLPQSSYVPAGGRPPREPNVLLIQPGKVADISRIGGNRTPLTLSVGDAQAIERGGKPAVVGAAPVVRARTTVTHGEKRWPPLYIYGTTPQFFQVGEWKLDQGRRFTYKEAKTRAPVCLLGQTVARELFGDESPVGKILRMNGRTLKVIGTLARKGENFLGLDQDDLVLAPLTAVRDKVNQSGDTPKETRPLNVDMILVRVRSAKEMPATIRQITKLLRKRHQICGRQPNDFNIRNLRAMAKALGR
jgi:macrolide transport system ATP-binding/permease protein